MKKYKKQLDKVDTIIGTATVVEGTLVAEGSLRVEGTVKGKLTCEGDLTVGAEGIVEAEVSGRNIVIAGTISGNVQASEKLHIERQGKLFGNATMQALVIEEGGIFEGESKMTYQNSENKQEIKAVAD